MTTENFADLLDESFGGRDGFEGSVLNGTVLYIDDDAVLIDVGLKSEGRIPLKEFGVGADADKIAVGDKIDVFVSLSSNASSSIEIPGPPYCGAICPTMWIDCFGTHI